MATILIIENRPVDRQDLTAIVRSRGYHVIEAADGREALDQWAEIAPDLVISDILMPTTDGYELVRRIRQTATGATTPVIFYTAAYHQREARVLADRCGVFAVVTRPASPVLLATVDAALSSRGAAASDDTALQGHSFDHDGPALPVRIDDFHAERERTDVVLGVAGQIASERDPFALITTVCAEARQVTLAQHAFVGLLAESDAEPPAVYTCGLDPETAARLQPPSVDAAVLGEVIRERRPVRTRNPEGRPEALGLPASHPAVSSLLAVPIASPARVYGWLGLSNKLGTDEFTEIDEQAAVTLGVHAGIAYENAHRLDALNRRVVALEQQVRRTAMLVREEERAQLSRTLHDQTGQILAGLKIDLRWLADQLPALTASSRDELIEKAEAILQRVDEAIESVRMVASELRPAILDKLGLVAAIEWQAEEFERRSGIRCRVDALIDRLNLDVGRATAAFKIVQEALTNVRQHSRATRANVKVRRTKRALTVSIADNGLGISDEDADSPDALGLIGMRERAALFGGTLRVRRRRPRGTVVTMTLPLADRPHTLRASS